MTRVLALVIALLFAAGLAAPVDVFAQSAKTDTKPAKGNGKAALLDINTASPAELETLSGIGEAYSKKIVENRPYKRKDELVRKKIIPQATYDKIKDRIIAKQGPVKK
jgi:DNA uptake protein ComE-like DNA-binding protein